MTTSLEIPQHLGNQQEGGTTDDDNTRRGHTIVLNSAVQAEFRCHEPNTAWCRRNVVGPGEERPEDPSWCYYTVLASGFELWSICDDASINPLDAHSGPVIFTLHDVDDITWRYEHTPSGTSAAEPPRNRG
jgi:hypothetical protein